MKIASLPLQRRQFITLLGAEVWPLAASAQRTERIRRIGMLIGYAENDPETQAQLAAFRQALEQLGWKDGSSVRIDYRFAPASPDQAQLFAKELVSLHPDVLLGNSTPATAALLRETRTIPIVFVGVPWAATSLRASHSRVAAQLASPTSSHH